MNKLKIILQSNIFSIFLILGIIFYVFYFTNIRKYESKYSNKTTKIEGEVLNFKIDDDKVRITLKAKEKIMVNYYIKNDEEKYYLENNLKEGSIILVEGNKTEISEPTIFNAFNYKKYLYNNHIYFTFLAKKINFINNDLSLINKIKLKISQRINKIERKEYVNAFILGDKNYIDSEIKEMIRSNGVSHLLALSGMHVNFIWLILKKLKVNNFLIFLFLGFYYFVAGMPVSFLRALLFMILTKLNKKYNWNIDNIKLLLYLAIFILIFNPFLVFDSAFIYTFVVTFSLLLFSKYIKIKGYGKNTLAISLITFLFSLPITLYLSYEFNLFSPLFNIILVPFVSLIIFPLTILVFLFPFLNSIYSIAIGLLENLNILMAKISCFIVIGKINFIEIGIYYLFLILLIKKRKIGYILFFSLIVFFLNVKANLDPNFYTYYLDVGQGDLIVLIFPFKKRVVMIDTGGKVSFKQKENKSIAPNILSFLKSKGINHLDWLILTHGDYDHMGEAINIVNNFKVKKVVFNCGEVNDLEQNLINVLNKKQIPYFSCLNELDIGINRLMFLKTRLYDNENDNSNVIYLKYNTYQFLFMGDASSMKEKDILNKYNLSNIDFLKVGHHGSDTSSSKEFINHINPKYALISVGKNNLYGHPKITVLNNLKNSLIYRTDINGSIEIKINKKKYRIRSCLAT